MPIWFSPLNANSKAPLKTSLPSKIMMLVVEEGFSLPLISLSVAMVVPIQMGRFAFPPLYSLLFFTCKAFFFLFLFFVLDYACFEGCHHFFIWVFDDLLRLYYTKIGLGSPAKDYYVQVDTGSDILWVNCVGCTTCPKKSGLGVCL